MDYQDFAADFVVANIPDVDYNAVWAEHREKLRSHLLLGLPGFIIGIILYISMMVSISDAASLFDLSLFEFCYLFAVAYICAPIMVGLIFAGIPFGWKILNRFLGQWVIFGSPIVVIAFFAFKLMFAYVIGGVAYPVVLIYHFIRSRKSNKSVRNWTIAVISLVAAWLLLVLLTSLL